MKAKQLSLNAMLCAMCAVLGYISIDNGAIKITFESLPILLAGMLFGSVNAMLVGGIGTLIYQLLRYGFSATTLLWMLPYIVCGLIAGAWYSGGASPADKKRAVVMTLCAELAVTVINTGALYVDAHIYSYYTPQLILANLPIRFALCFVKAPVFGLALAGLSTPVKKAAGIMEK